MKQKKQARTYKKVPQEIRDIIISNYFTQKQNFKQLSAEHHVNVSTVKSIIKIYKNEGRSIPKITKPRKAKQIYFHSANLVLEKNLVPESTLSPPKSFFQSFKDCSINQKVTADFKAIPIDKSQEENKIQTEKIVNNNQNQLNCNQVTPNYSNLSFNSDQKDSHYQHYYENLLFQNNMIYQRQHACQQQQMFGQSAYGINYYCNPNYIAQQCMIQNQYQANARSTAQFSKGFQEENEHF